MQPRPYATAKELRHLLRMRTHPKTVVNFELEPVLAHQVQELFPLHVGEIIGNPHTA